MNPLSVIALRMDDVGASSIKYEIYSNENWRIGPLRVSGNWLFLKYLSPFRAWGPYKEMSVGLWKGVIHLLHKHKAKLTVAVTATWADGERDLKPFPTVFPHQAGMIKEAVQDGVVEVANHGLCHCVLERDAFKPKMFSGNREFHREFGPHISAETQRRHLGESQNILENWLGSKVVTFVPPGNQFVPATLKLAEEAGLRFVSCNSDQLNLGNIIVLGNRATKAFHDRDIVLHGIEWFEELLLSYRNYQFCFVRELTALGGDIGN
jgi:peptidoglycan/xylan/chitin deacetylase (PgdA/CDA1 family)